MVVVLVSIVSSILCTATVLLTEEPAFYKDGRLVNIDMFVTNLFIGQNGFFYLIL